MTPPPDRRGPPPQPPRGGGVPSKLADSSRRPAPPGPPRPPAGPPRGAPPPPRRADDDEHPATQGGPPRPGSRGPGPASQGHRKPQPGASGKLAKTDHDPKHPPAFEIRRGRASPEAGDDDDQPMGPVVLPRSITQEAEEERLKERFGVDHLPEVKEVNSLVRMTASQGTLGPDRARRRMMVVVLLLLVAVAGAAFWAHKQGLLEGVLGP